MKYQILLFVVLISVSVSQKIETSEYLNQFNSFITEYEKHYPNTQTYETAFKNFINNIKFAEKFNEEQEKGYETYGINKFFDMTQEEIESKILMRPQPPVEFTESQTLKVPENYLQNGDVPESWDWREHGAVTSVKDQGSVGSCWAFSTVGNVEGQWALAGNDLVSLSPEQLVECDSTINPPDADCGVFGGWPYLGMTYIKKVGGIASLADYRYCVGVPVKQDPCYPCTAPGFDEKLCGPGIFPPSCNPEKWHCRDDTVHFTAHIDGWNALDQDEEVLKKQLYEIGPISIALNASSLWRYKKGIYNPKHCKPEKLNHAVLLVGYGVDEETQQDYWLVKNSWGEKWGENGYFRILRGVGKCGVNRQPVSATVPKKESQKVEQI